MIAQLLEMLLLLGDLLLELQQLLLLALLDGIVLVGLLAFHERVAVCFKHQLISYAIVVCCFVICGGGIYLEPPRRGEPVSPSDMTRSEVVKARRGA